MKKGRLSFIDILRGIAIICIVLGHVFGHAEHAKPIVKFLYSFHVPMFFLISGYLYNYKNLDFKSFFKKKTIRIIIPYFVWALLFLIPYYLFGTDATNKLSANTSFDFMTSLTSILKGNGASSALAQNSALWFLPALFSMEIIYYFIFNFFEKYKLKKYLPLLIAVLTFIFVEFSKSFILPFGISNVFILGGFFYLGYLIKEYNFVEKYKNIDYVSIICIILIAVYACFTNSVIVYYMDYIYGNILLMFIAGLFLSMFFLYISYKISNNKVLEYIGKNTMGILIFHKIIIVFFQTKLGVISKLLLNSNIFIETLLGVLVAIIAIVISLIINYFIRKYFPILIGESKVGSRK